MTISFRIDAHQHFWNPARGDYSWMTPGTPLHRRFLPSDLAPLNEAAGIGATVVVQAAPTISETMWLLERADDPDSRIAGVVGWVDLAAEDVARQLDRIADPRVIGVRPMIQDLDPDWIRQPQVVRGLREVEARGLVFELLAKPEHLAPAADVLVGIDGLRVVIDHLGKPQYREWSEDWAQQITRFAERDLTWMKISGLATEVDPSFEPTDFARHVDFALNAFGADRSMLGTDWPVSTLALAHPDMVAFLDSLVAGYSSSERNALWRDSCVAAFSLDLTGAPA